MKSHRRAGKPNLVTVLSSRSFVRGTQSWESRNFQQPVKLLLEHVQHEHCGREAHGVYRAIRTPFCRFDHLEHASIPEPAEHLRALMARARLREKERVAENIDHRRGQRDEVLLAA